MPRICPALARIRPVAGPVLLGVFCLAAQLAPLAHLATHHNDHTHGPVAATAGHDDSDHHDDDHEASHIAGLDHDHDVPAGVWDHDDDHLVGDDHANGGAAATHDDDQDHDRPTAPPAGDHGRGSIAHLGLALIEGPPSLHLPTPAGTLARPRDVTPRWHHAPPLPQPPARGPPCLP